MKKMIILSVFSLTLLPIFSALAEDTASTASSHGIFYNPFGTNISPLNTEYSSEYGYKPTEFVADSVYNPEEFDLDGLRVNKDGWVWNLHNSDLNNGNIMSNALGIDCDPDIYASDFGLKDLDQHINQERKEEVCLDQLVPNGYVPELDRSKEYCQCVASKYKGPISKNDIQVVDLMLQQSAEAQTRDYAINLIRANTVMNFVLQENAAQDYLINQDNVNLCQRKDLEKIIADLQSGKGTACTPQRIDKVLSQAHTKAEQMKNRPQLADAMQNIPRTSKALFEQFDSMLSDYKKVDENFNDALKQMIEIHQMIENGVAKYEDFSQEAKEGLKKSVQFISDSLKDNPNFKRLKLTINIGDGKALVINPKGEKELSDYLPVNKGIISQIGSADPEIRKKTIIGLLQPATYQVAEFNTKENSQSLETCNKLFEQFDTMCREVDEHERYKAKALVNKPEMLLAAFARSKELKGNDIQAIGALQCYMGGLAPNVLSPEADAYAKEKLSGLSNLPPSLIGSHLIHSKNFQIMLREGWQTENVDLKSIQGARDNYADVFKESESAQKTKKSLFDQLGVASRGSLIDKEGHFNVENLGVIARTNYAKKTDYIKEIDDRTVTPNGIQQAVAVPQAQLVTPQSNVAGFVNPFSLHNRVNAKKKVEKAPQVKDEPKEKSGFEKFEERLSKMFSGEKKEEPKGKSTKSRAERAKESYNYKTTQQNTINELRDEINKLKKDKDRPAEVSVAAVAKPTASTAVVPFAPVASNISSSPSTSSNQASAATPGTNRASNASSTNGASSRASAAPQGSTMVESSGVKASAAVSSGKGSSGGSNFNLSRDEIEGSDKFIISSTNFDANDQGFIKDLFEKTQGEPIYLSSTDEQGNEKFIMLEAVENDDGTIEYIPVEAEHKDERLQVQRDKNGKKKKTKRSRVKVQDLNSLLGEKL